MPVCINEPATNNNFRLSQMTSVERIQQYEKLEQEAPEHTAFPLPSEWPSEGRMEFRKVTLTYNKHGSRKALTDMQISIASKEKVSSPFYVDM